MALNSSPVLKQIVRIVTVDPATRRIEGILRDRSTIQIDVRDVPPVFRWPIVGENWSVVYQNGWVLDSLLELGEAGGDMPVEGLEPGDAKIGADRVYDRAGNLLVGANPDDVANGEYLRRVAGRWVTETVTTGGGGGSDAFFEYDQVVPASTWVITHGLGKFPSVTVVDSSGDTVFGDVHFNDTNTVTVTFSGAFSGVAYLN